MHPSHKCFAYLYFFKKTGNQTGKAIRLTFEPARFSSWTGLTTKSDRLQKLSSPLHIQRHFTGRPRPLQRSAHSLTHSRASDLKMGRQRQPRRPKPGPPRRCNKKPQNPPAREREPHSILPPYAAVHTRRSSPAFCAMDAGDCSTSTSKPPQPSAAAATQPSSPSVWARLGRAAAPHPSPLLGSPSPRVPSSSRLLDSLFFPPLGWLSHS
jgi:hypothetical protein